MKNVFKTIKYWIMVVYVSLSIVTYENNFKSSIFLSFS